MHEIDLDEIIKQNDNGSSEEEIVDEEENGVDTLSMACITTLNPFALAVGGNDLFQKDKDIEIKLINFSTLKRNHMKQATK